MLVVDLCVCVMLCHNVIFDTFDIHSPHALCHRLRRKSISNPMGDLYRLTQTNREKTENDYAQIQSHIKRLYFTFVHIQTHSHFEQWWISFFFLLFVECGRPLIQHASMTIANFNSFFTSITINLWNMNAHHTDNELDLFGLYSLNCSPLSSLPSSTSGIQMLYLHSMRQKSLTVSHLRTKVFITFVLFRVLFAF